MRTENSSFKAQQRHKKLTRQVVGRQVNVKCLDEIVFFILNLRLAIRYCGVEHQPCSLSSLSSVRSTSNEQRCRLQCKLAPKVAGRGLRAGRRTLRRNPRDRERTKGIASFSVTDVSSRDQLHPNKESDSSLALKQEAQPLCFLSSLSETFCQRVP